MQTNKKNYFYIPIITILALLTAVPATLEAQYRLQTTFVPGVFLENTDQYLNTDGDPYISNLFGISTTGRFAISGWTLDVSTGYSGGTQNLYWRGNRNVSARYRTIPLELLFGQSVHDRVHLSAGFNIVGQHRILEFERIGIDNDRLLSFGAGLSGKIHYDLIRLFEGQGTLFAKIGLRWTEFFLHDENGRDLDDFQYRHIVLNPGVGVSYHF